MKKQSVKNPDSLSTILLVILLIVCLLGIVLFSTYQPLKEQTRKFLESKPFVLESIPNEDNSAIQSPQNPLTASVFPQTVIRNWQSFPSSFDVSLKSAPTYTLKNTYRLSESESIAQIFGMSDNLKQYGSLAFSFSASNDNNNGGLFIMDLQTGAIHYASIYGISLQLTTSENLYHAAETFLRKNGLIDETVHFSGSYQRHSSPDTVFLEFKRSWDAVNLPILNPLGLLNTPETRPFAQMSQTKQQDSIADPDIYATDNQTDGLSRKNDFNTLTIQVHKPTKTIRSLISALRAITQKSKDQSLINFQEAKNALIQKSSHVEYYTAPAGEGANTPWETIFPDNTASINEAKSTDVILTYLEHIPGIAQSSLTPYYLFRANGNLSSGYRADIIAAVPAVRSVYTKTDKYNTLRQLSALIAPIAAAQAPDAGLKQSIFDLLTPTPNPYPPTPTPDFSETCIPAVETLAPRSTIQSSDGSSVLTVGRSHIGVINNVVRLSRKGWWYFTPARSSDEQTLRNDYAKALVLIQSVTGQSDWRIFRNDTMQWGVYYDYLARGTQCPIRITGDSPTIFVYAPINASVSITPKVPLTYEDPPDWSKTPLTVQTDQTIRAPSSFERPYLYYEYTGVNFTRPKTGWNVPKTDVVQFIHTTLAPLYRLNDNEKTRLTFEIEHAGYAVDSDIWYIAPLSQKDIEKHIPLHVSDTSLSVQRIHFYVAPADNSQIYNPKTITPVSRNQPFILELGAFNPN